MIKPRDPRELAVDLLPRSQCQVQVAAVIADGHGIFSWGWNSAGPTGMGQHAEAHAVARANKRRLDGATIYVAAKRKRNNKIVMSAPCVDCQALVRNWDLRVFYRDADSKWYRVR